MSNFERNFIEYPGQVWATCYQAISWLNNLLDGGAAPVATVAGPAGLVYTLCREASVSVDAWGTAIALGVEVTNLAQVQALPLTLDPTTTSYFNNRITAVELAAQQIFALIPPANPFTIVGQLQNGIATMLQSNYLTWCLGFQGEPAPSGLTAATLPTLAQTAATSWLNVTNAVGIVQGANLTSAYDTAARMYRCSQTVATAIGSLQSGPFGEGGIADWNGCVALPTILLDGNSLATSPALLLAQQGLVIRYLLNQTATQIATFLTTLQTTIASRTSTANLNNTDTLMDLAARQTGNFENWGAIALINNLQPPYPGPTNPTLALSGTPLYMPGSNITIGVGQTPPSYPNSTMGTDYYFGPINGIQPPWNGDIAQITGYQNFAQALGRRLQTPLGSLVYHTNYGSRIPGEIGAIQSSDEAARLSQFGTKAIEADKRTAKVLRSTATVQPGQLATFQAVVQPIGPNATPITIGGGNAPLIFSTNP